MNSIGSLARAALSCESFPEVPSPEENAAEEDLENLSESAFVSEDEESGDEEKIMEELDMLGSEDEAESENESDDGSKQIEKALKLLHKASVFQMKAYNLLRRVNMSGRMPSDQFASAICGFNQSRGGDLQRPAEASTRPDNVNMKMIVPLRISSGGKTHFRCPQCDVAKPSWSGADSHIRKVHTFAKYGPCQTCTFTSYNLDSFRGHSRLCVIKQTSK